MVIDEKFMEDYGKLHEASPDFMGERQRKAVMIMSQKQFDEVVALLYERCKYMGMLEDFPKIYAIMIKWRMQAGTFRRTK